MTPENVELIIKFAGVALILFMVVGLPAIATRRKKDD